MKCCSAQCGFALSSEPKHQGRIPGCMTAVRKLLSVCRPMFHMTCLLDPVGFARPRWAQRSHQIAPNMILDWFSGKQKRNNVSLTKECHRKTNVICKHIAKQQNCASKAKLQKRVTNDIPLNENDQIILFAGKLSHPSPNSAAQPAQPTQPASQPASQSASQPASNHVLPKNWKYAF